MITFKQFILEAFNTRANIITDKSSKHESQYRFEVDGEMFSVLVSRAFGTNQVSFGLGDRRGMNYTQIEQSFKQTSRNANQFKILSAVIDTITQHFKQYPLGTDRITFSSDGTSRTRAYRSMAKRLCTTFGLEMEEIGTSSDTTFIMGKDL